MAIEVRSTLRKALGTLQSEQDRIERQISAVQAALAALAGRGAGRNSSATGKRRRKPMSAAARKAVGRRMKAYWAKRKAKGRNTSSK